eukprot:Gb_05766 [translate_table: standard]
MGNYRSCACRNTNSLKVIAFNGRILEFQKPIKAVELMLENPQHFVCHANALQTGHRIAALSADEELEQGNTYLLLPMDKLRSVVSPSDMAALALRSVSSRMKVSSNSKVMAKIFPVLFGDIWQLPVDRKDGIATGELCKQRRNLSRRQIASHRRLWMTPTLFESSTAVDDWLSVAWIECSASNRRPSKWQNSRYPNCSWMMFRMSNWDL